jgi:hypothetical protein
MKDNVHADRGEKIRWFSEADYDDRGNVIEYMPSYTNRRLLSRLKDEINESERIVKDGIISGRALLALKDDLADKKNRLDSILDKRKINGTYKDKISGSLKEISSEINDALFTYDEARKVSVSAHENVRRMTTPCINVKDEVASSIANDCGIKIKNGKVTREEAIRIAKIMKHNLEECVPGSFQYRK